MGAIIAMAHGKSLQFVRVIFFSNVPLCTCNLADSFQIISFIARMACAGEMSDKSRFATLIITSILGCSPYENKRVEPPH